MLGFIGFLRRSLQHHPAGPGPCPTQAGPTAAPTGPSQGCIAYPRGRPSRPSVSSHNGPNSSARAARSRSSGSSAHSRPLPPAPHGGAGQVVSGHSYRRRQVLKRPDLCENGAGHGRNQGEQPQPRAAPGRQHRHPRPAPTRPSSPSSPNPTGADRTRRSWCCSAGRRTRRYSGSRPRTWPSTRRSGPASGTYCGSVSPRPATAGVAGAGRHVRSTCEGRRDGHHRTQRCTLQGSGPRTTCPGRQTSVALPSTTGPLRSLGGDSLPGGACRAGPIRRCPSVLLQPPTDRLSSSSSPIPRQRLVGGAHACG